MIRYIFLLLLIKPSLPTKFFKGYTENSFWPHCSKEILTFKIYGNYKIDGIRFQIGAKKNTSVKALSSLRNKNLQRLPEQVHDVFPNLIAYQVGKSSVSKIVRQNFEKLSKLEWLYLGQNKIKEINEGVFDDLVMLKYLYLNNNEIDMINAKAFDKLKKLIVVTLNDNALTYLALNTFDNLNMLRNISLHNNQLEHLEGGPEHYTFPNSVKLEFIWLNNNHIQFIGKDIFNSMLNLEYVDLRNNNCINKEYFKNQHEIMKHDFSENC